MEKVRWREFWEKDRKGKQYYGSGEGELEHDKEA